MRNWSFYIFFVIVLIAWTPPLIAGENKWERYKTIKIDSLICVVADPHKERSFYGWHLRMGFVKRTKNLDWQRISLKSFPSNFRPNKIVPNPYRTREVYACTNAGLYRSVDEGKSWVQLGFAGIEVLACAVTSSPIVFYAATNRGLQRSINDGGTWETIPARSFNFEEVRAMTISKLHSQHIYIGTSNGIMKYEVSDSLRRLSKHEQFSPFVSVVDLINAPHYANVIFAISDTSGVFWAEDGDKVYWREMNQNLIKPYPHFISAVLTRKQQLQIFTIDISGQLWRYKFLIPSVAVFDPKSENLAQWQKAEVPDICIAEFENSYRIKWFSLNEFKSYPSEDRLREIAKTSGCDAAFYHSIDPNSSIVTKIFFFYSDKAREKTLQESCTPENLQIQLRKTLKEVRKEMNQELVKKPISFSDFLFKKKSRWFVWPILTGGVGTLVAILMDSKQDSLSYSKRLPSPPLFPGKH